MRLKQLLGILAILAALSTMPAAAAVSQLVDVRVRPQGDASMVAIKANGTFTHTEYRPVDNLLLVDLAGVSAGKLDGKSEQLSVPGVTSYRVVGYKGNDGAEIARIEIAVVPGAVVRVTEASGALHVLVRSTAAAAVPAAAEPAPVVAKAAMPQAAPTAGVVRVQGVSVARGENGMEVEIAGSGPMTATTSRLRHPERIVLDIANAVPPARGRKVAVNSGQVKSVRVAQFQSAPPATRVVVDLLAAQKFELVNEGNKLRLRLSGAEAVAASVPAQAEAPAAPAVESATAPVAEPAAAKAAPVHIASTPKVTPMRTRQPIAPRVASSQAPKLNLQAGIPALAEQPKQEHVPIIMAAVQPKQDAKPFPVVVAAEQPKPEIRPAATTIAVERTPQDFVVVQPTIKEPAATEASKAEEAASRFAAPQPAIPLTNFVPVNAAMKPQSVPAVNMALQQQQQMAQGQGMPQTAAPTSCSTGRYTGEPISVNLKDVDVKDFFRLIHEISSLNVVLDPNVRGSLTLVLADVPWDQALAIVLKNNSLECQLEGNVLRIATTDTLKKEADSKRAQLESQSLAVPKVTFTRYLSYAHSKDIVPTIKRFLSSRGEVISDDRTNALIIEDIPGVIPNIDRLIRELDRKTQEVEIEARVVAATRSFARDIGTQLGFGWGNRPTAVGGATGAGTSPVQVGGLTPNYIVTGNNSIPLFSNMPAVGATSGLSFTNATNNYRLDFVLTMAESRGLLKILSRPRVVTQNNIRAIVKQGVRIPVVTAAQLGGPPTTTYIEAALRLTVTPQITAEGTIFLDVDVENTTPDFGTQVNGNPTLITQQATTQVLVTDGGTVVIGGVIQTQNSVNTQQVPLLGDIPVLGNLFKRRSVSTSTQELIFFITPKIIQT